MLRTVENLCTPLLFLRKMVLMDAQKESLGILFRNSKPAVDIRNLAVADSGNPLLLDGTVGIPNHYRFKSAE